MSDTKTQETASREQQVDSKQQQQPKQQAPARVRLSLLDMLESAGY